jgi:hypothetical protein
MPIAPRRFWPAILTGFFISVSWVQVSVCTPVIPMMFYLLIGFTEYSVDPGISRGAYKLARTLRVIKIKKKIMPIIWTKKHTANFLYSKGIHFSKFTCSFLFSWRSPYPTSTQPLPRHDDSHAIDRNGPPAPS